MKNNFTFLTLLLLAFISAPILKAEDLIGKAIYQGDVSRPIGYVSVALKNVDNNTIQTYKTGADGSYQFMNVPNGNYSLTGTTSIAGGGVSYYDAAMVFLHLAGKYQFSPIQMLASDVNGSGTVNWTDYNLIIKNILFGKPFPTDPWKFETINFTISNLKESNPKGLGGTCSGDVGGTFVPTANSTPALPVAQEGVINVTGGDLFTTKILTHNELSITGAGLIINYPSELLQIESVEFKGADYEYNIENGQIRLVWGDPNTAPVNFNDGETFITIHGICTSAFKEGMTASIGMDGNTSLINASNKEETKLNFASPLIKFGKPSMKLSNYPNPFKNSTRLNIYTPQEGNATIEVYSASGQLVKNISAGLMNAGFNEVNLDASQLAKGYYICKIRVHAKTTEFSDSMRLLKAE
jgi:hypothetical protein